MAGRLRPQEWAGVAVDSKRERIYAADSAGRLCALQESDGRRIWCTELGGEHRGRPLLTEEGDLIIAHDNGQVHFYSAQTLAGKSAPKAPAWSYSMEGLVHQRPLVADGMVYLVSSRNAIVALDVRSGAWRWSYERELPPEFRILGRAGLGYQKAESSPDGRGPKSGKEGTGKDGSGLEESGPGGAGEEIAQDTQGAVLYSGFDDGRIVAIDAVSGQSLWIADRSDPQDDTLDDADAQPQVDLPGQQVIAANVSQGIVALDLAKGSPKWRIEVPDVVALQTVSDGIFAAASASQGLWLFDRHGQLRWRLPLERGSIGGLKSSADLLWLSHSQLGLLGIEAATGELLARFDLGFGVNGDPVINPASSSLYVITNGGWLVGFDLPIALRAPS